MLIIIIIYYYYYYSEKNDNFLPLLTFTALVRLYIEFLKYVQYFKT